MEGDYLGEVRQDRLVSIKSKQGLTGSGFSRSPKRSVVVSHADEPDECRPPLTSTNNRVCNATTLDH